MQTSDLKFKKCLYHWGKNNNFFKKYFTFFKTVQKNKILKIFFFCKILEYQNWWGLSQNSSSSLFVSARCGLWLAPLQASSSRPKLPAVARVRPAPPAWLLSVLFLLGPGLFWGCVLCTVYCASGSTLYHLDHRANLKQNPKLKKTVSVCVTVSRPFVRYNSPTVAQS